MNNSALSRHGLDRRRTQLQDLRRYLQTQEDEFCELHRGLRAFVDRYVSTLGCAYLELDSLEFQLHAATQSLADGLRRNGVQARTPRAPQATALPTLPVLPPATQLPPEPTSGTSNVPPPSLKTLYRRAAMRLHPDFASSEQERQRREQAMMLVNEAYAAQRRGQLEALLLATGEDPIKVRGGDGDALQHWVSQCEIAVQGRLRVVQAHRVALEAHPMHQLWQAIARAERMGLDPFNVMIQRLRSQIAERRQELYIGQRLQPEAGMAEEFLRRRIERMGVSVGVDSV